MGKQRDEVLRALRRRIVEGHYVPGQLFSENEVVEDLKDQRLSRTPVREAFAVLDQEGLIEQHPRRGVTVRFIGRSEAREILRLRRSIELMVVEELARSNSPDRLHGVDDLLDGMDAAAADGDVKKFLNLDSEFHCLLALNAGFNTAADVLRTLRDKIRIMGLDSVEQTRNLTDANHAHRAIASAVADDNRDLAVRLIQQHLDLTGRRLLGEVTAGLPSKVKEIGDLIEKARDMRHRGRRMNDVITVLEQAVSRASESEELHHELMQALVELSATRRMNRDFRTAEKHALQALEISELHGNRTGIAWANYELGRIALDDNEPARPGDLQRLEKALALGADEDRLNGWINYSLALKNRRGDTDVAWRHARTALEILERNGDRWGVAQALDMLGQLAAATSRPEEANDYFHRARAIADHEDFPSVKASTAVHRTTLPSARLSPGDAKAELEGALDLYASIDDVQGVKRAREGLRNLERSQTSR